MQPYLTAVSFLAGSLCAAAVFRRHYKSQAEKMYQSLLETLDRSLHGELLQEQYDESMSAAVIARLNRLVKTVRMHQQSAEKERDTVKALISDISHQVRTPLTNMMLYTGLLKEQPLCADARLFVDRLQKQSDKLDFFMKELVKSSYMEQDMIAIHPKRENAAQLMQTACQLVELSAMEKEIVIALHTQQAEQLFCYADQKWTVEAISNVIENAVKYSPPRSVIDLSAVSYEMFVCIQVKDDGIGIREEEQGLVFRRFYRSDDVKEQPGYGIGLYLVREVLGKQGGYAKIRSEYRKGTVVQLYLLKADADEK